ncbi:hypothetical protein FRC14_006489 [Serendipita sp. 396]|nr:hypothetical protein FRC14_006489 [Serendipita sp. 396]KAG8778929.1 hypothetical protein FRC15_010457 [Serendipita sp. 397]KAG8830834.1 hypothetical protein FRC18_007550 [Serendipita sp. 400]KAG8865929.1 hypothetical protein FRC20_009282 [Serendipita sp. 405]
MQSGAGKEIPDSGSGSIGSRFTSYSAGAAAGGSGTAMSADLYPQVEDKNIKQVCQRADVEVIPFVKDFEDTFNKLPDERGITDRIALLIQQSKAGKVIFHSQSQEGKSGVDFLIEMHFMKHESQNTVVDITQMLAASSLGGASQPGSSTRGDSIPGGSTPGAGSASSPDTERRQTRSKSRQQIASPATNVPAQVQSPSHKQAITSAGKSANAGGLSDIKHVVFLQAKSYHLKGDDNSARIADFTYKGKKKEGQPEKPMQMELLKNAVIEARIEYKGATIVGGYLLYDPEEIVFIPLDDILHECKANTCTGSSASTNKAMSIALRENHSTRKSENPGERPCFMHDLATAKATKAE